MKHHSQSFLHFPRKSYEIYSFPTNFCSYIFLKTFPFRAFFSNENNSLLMTTCFKWEIFLIIKQNFNQNPSNFNELIKFNGYNKYSLITTSSISKFNPLSQTKTKTFIKFCLFHKFVHTLGKTPVQDFPSLKHFFTPSPYFFGNTWEKFMLIFSFAIICSNFWTRKHSLVKESTRKKLSFA